MPAFAALRDNPEFKRIAGQIDAAGVSREQGWALDIDYLRDEVARTSPDYRNAALPADFVKSADDLKKNISRLSDEQVFVGMTRMLALLKAGHTTLFSPPGTRWLPVRPYAFPEGVFIIGAESAHTSLVGAQITAIGRMSIDSVLRALAIGRSVDGDMEHLWSTSDIMVTHYLKGIGAITRADSVPVTLKLTDGTTKAVTFATGATEPAARQDKLMAPPRVGAPLFLSNVDEKHWYAPLPEGDAIYFQFNNVSNDKDETLVAFGRRFWTVLDSAKPKNLIVDMRHNNGGSTAFYPELLRTITAFSRIPGNQVYALIGRRTYSATANFITDLERLANPIWVGEASSECCSFHGDPTSLTLPYSRIQAELTAVRWNLGANVFDKRREMSPDVPVQLTAKAYFAGEDPALAAVLAVIAGRARQR